MPYITLSSGLTIKVPTRGTRNWADEMLAQTFTKISSHDHTGSGKGLPIGTNALSNLAVTSGKIADGAVTLAKMADLATDRLIGRDTAGSGVPEAISLTGGLEFSGSTSIRVADLGITSAKLAADAVTTAKILDANITEAKLADDAATRSCIILRTGESRDLSDGTAAIQELPMGIGQVSRFTLPKAAKVTHLSCDTFSAVTGGTFTVTLYKNGVTTGKTLVVTSGTNNSGAITAESFAAGDEISIAVTMASVTFSGGSSNGTSLTAWGHFTE